jgi:hypothetical protein
MPLTNPQKDATRREWVTSQVQSSSQPIQFNKADLRAAITAIDDWATANSASFNTALPEPFKTQATATQKAALFAFVVLRRFTG